MAGSQETLNPAQRKPEILAPAGGMPQLEAAVHGGADAVYFGLQRGFNARVRSAGFEPEALGQAMHLLHTHGCRGYLTLNTLIFDEELAEVEQQIRHAAQSGVDALIVQDIGVARLARATAPNLPLHASTQMSITDADGVRFAQSLGMKRVVLGRELSIDEIAAVNAETALELEVFVHGALCVSYSGQCFSSEAWGGRSANRGQCAQACRLPYGLLVDGQVREQGDFNYLLSPQDLMALPMLPRLLAAGVNSLKIEGRLKGPEYVLNTVRAYRELLDRAWQEHLAGLPAEDTQIAQQTRRRLAQVFSRGQNAEADGLTPGFLNGPRHQELVIGRSPRHRGLYLGRVEQVTGQGVVLDLSNPVKAGDGVVFDCGRPQTSESGGNVFHVLGDERPIKGEIDHGRVELGFGRNFRTDKVNIGDLVWRTKDAAMDSGPNLHRENAARGIPLYITAKAGKGEPLQLTLRDTQGHESSGRTKALCEPAQRAALDEKSVRKAIGQLGDTPFDISDMKIQLDDGLFLPVGEIKQARREAVQTLLKQLQRHARDRDMPSTPVLATLLPRPAPVGTTPAPRFSLLCRTHEQVKAALALVGIEEIVVDFLEVHGLKAACEQVRMAGRRLVVATPRIFKPSEQRLVRYLLRLHPDALLVRSTGLLQMLLHLGGSGACYDEETRIPELYGDFSLNACNVLSANMLLDAGLARLAPTHDANAAQLNRIALTLPSGQRDRLEIIAHHHLPIFHTEYCAFARYLSAGNSYRDCGRPCEEHRLHLRDQGGADHLVLADIGCRNTVFNAQAQSAAPYLHELRESGVSRFRIELVDEPGDQVAAIVDGYLALAEGKVDHRQLWKQLRQVPDANRNAQGVGPGSLAVRVEQSRSEMKKPTAR